ncbi:hypothetical protein [Niallia endozanthoxylica]|uniref:DoxX family protein n=1 Tax=Niallia endozanthoxylica TaxID=2036016 RepID=A0A5J5GV14_9BACI|nr:hypothetical protein [Niallia endozanthoxylica]KAA9011877.1 hypothetical protein F4V44_26385 [Niallia endozanthoxylica]
MKKFILHTARIFIGLVFLVAGVNGYLVIFGQEPFIANSPEAMKLFEFDYLLIIEKSLEILCAVLLLSNRYIPLALAILAPLITNIFLLHLFVDHSLLPLVTVLVIVYSYMLFHYRRNFRSIFEKKP